MKGFVISATKVVRVVIVGLVESLQDEKKTEEYLNGLEFLAEDLGQGPMIDRPSVDYVE